VVHPAGFEPATPWFEAKYSNPLSYGCVMPYTILTEKKVKAVKPIKSLDEANSYLNEFYPFVHADYKLDNMLDLMKFLDNPQEKFNVVHVAGTSGKTSTAYFMTALLLASGRKVGLTISPHLDSINERVQLNGKPLPEAEFCAAFTEFLGIVDSSGTKPSRFELMVAFAYWYFAKAGVDYAVIEVGLGGLLDGTNVINNPSKVCIITDIGLDHMHVLGNSLTEIASQKIGIVKPGNVTFTHKQSKEVIKVFYEWALEHEATLRVVDGNIETAENIPAFQLRNWSLAYEAYRYIVKRDDLEFPTLPDLLKTQRTQVPGRMDVRQLDNKTLIMDGAHNFQKMKAFVYSLNKLHPLSKTAILISLKDGKEYEDLVPLLRPIASRVIVTQFELIQDAPIRSMDSERLAKAFMDSGVEAESEPDQHLAYQKLLKGPEKICIITGSIYLLGQIRNNESLV
jgi:dihydrofolate synthase/folylpolyglutamate synthase